MLILPRFFQLLRWTSQEKSVDTTEKSALKLINLPNLKAKGIKRAKIQLSKVAKIYRSFFSILWFNLILSLHFIFLLFQIHYHVIINYTLPYRKIPKISPRAYIFQRPFLRSLSTEGNLRFKIDQASLILEVNLPFLPCFTLYLRTIFQVQALGGHIFGRA